MADHTKIEWTDATWNPITGCAVTSPGCANCYAMRLAGTRLQDHPSRAGLTRPSKAGPVWTGETRLNESWLTQPLGWSRPRRIFVCAHGDLFAESVPDAWIDRIFAVMALAPQHTYQVLTKRARRMREYLSSERDRRIARACVDLVIAGVARIGENWPVESIGDIDLPDDIKLRQWPLPKVWIGVSVEDQTRADERIPDLLEAPAARRWISAEPLLGAVDLLKIDVTAWARTYRPGSDIGQHPHDPDMRWPLLRPFEHAPSGWTSSGLDWVVVGGESGPGARPMHPDWPRDIRDQCEAAGVPFFFKQWGEWGDRCESIHVSRESAIWRDGAFARTSNSGKALDAMRSGGCVVQRSGKAASARLLDGDTHDAMPGRQGRRG